MRTTPHVVLALVAVGVAVVGLNSQGRSGATGQARLTHIPRSTVKVEQLIGDYDKERKAATRSQTESRYGLEGTDLGSSFEHGGRASFLFGAIPIVGDLFDIAFKANTRNLELLREHLEQSTPRP
ncbi:MAG: DUF4112 domain-containing protein [Acidobacteria bacterium]|nr:DUF4112 domain-containing protein [Acidobacteriota bacterium]